MRTRILGLVVAITACFLLLGCSDPNTPTSDTVVNLAAIPGVAAPVLGATPVTTITETAQYTGTVAWSGSPGTFGAGTVYTATLTLTAKAGYTLAGVAADFFTVAGATSDTNPANSGVVTAVFPATGDGSYTSVNIGTLKYVPAGRFQRDAITGHISVITQAYRMSQHEITRAQFQTILGTDPSNTSSSNGSTDPVQMTNWYHAIAFCNKLSLAEGLTPVYVVADVNFETLTYTDIPTTSNTNWNAATATWANNGYRLPTEMEWLWAAMGAPADGQGGGTNTTGYAKAFAGSTGSNAIGDYTWYSANSGEKTHVAGTKTANELGLYDMSGNVGEWCWDWCVVGGTWPNYAEPGTLENYRGAASGENRVLRGGSWNGFDSDCSIANRLNSIPLLRNNRSGFRVVRP